VGRSLEMFDDVARKRTVNSFRASTAASEAPAGRAELNDRSHIERRALPCATDARRPTVHIIAASRVSSSSMRSIGFRCAARTNGRVVEAYEEREKVKNVGKDDFGRVWARYDSRPLLNANEPRGRAESDRRRRKW
jgi:hypothetical protein